ncbi:MAG: hypothetical protein ACT4O0_04510 [Pseudonocardia sp.]
MGGSLLLPPTASGSPAVAYARSSADDHGDRFPDENERDDHDERDDYRARAADRGDDLAAHRRDRETPRSRPMTSGERQYRNGCRQGYISEGCERFSIGELVKRGINPSR